MKIKADLCQLFKIWFYSIKSGWIAFEINQCQKFQKEKPTEEGSTVLSRAVASSIKEANTFLKAVPEASQIQYGTLQHIRAASHLVCSSGSIYWVF